jgi:SAM-dependent methyltransferase
VLLTLSTTASAADATTDSPATDLGFLLHKNPARPQAFELSVGVAHVFYPQASRQRCTVALLLEVDPVALVRGRRGPSGEGFSLGQYVNDRPYAASSLLAVALSRVFRTAMTGRCEARPELAASPLPLEVRVPVLPCRGGPELARRLFEPLGWQVEATSIALDETVPEWGESRYVDLRLTGELRLAEALNQLYVLLPVLDDAKHYWVSTDEVDKLIRSGAGWLAGHPEATLVTRRYLAHQGALQRSALARLAEVDDAEPEAFDNAVPDGVDNAVPDGIDNAVRDGVPDVVPDGVAGVVPSGVGPDPVEQPVDRPAPLAVQRQGAVLAVLRAAGVQRVADVGCGEGALTAALLADRSFSQVIATDVSARALAVAERRLHLDRMSEPQRARLQLLLSSVTYQDDRLKGLDAIVLMEVVEHVDPPRLGALERCVFGHAAPRVVVVTTPNVEHNVRYESLPAGSMRHRDHRFEWTRAELGAWGAAAADRFGYAVRFLPVGPDDPEVGPPTQLAVFTREVAV